MVQIQSLITQQWWYLIAILGHSSRFLAYNYDSFFRLGIFSDRQSRKLDIFVLVWTNCSNGGCLLTANFRSNCYHLDGKSLSQKLLSIGTKIVVQNKHCRPIINPLKSGLLMLKDGQQKKQKWIKTKTEYGLNNIKNWYF